jgi:hypothetical protein
MGPYYHGMAHPRVADEGDGLQIWRVVANVLNRQSRRADKEWSSSLGGGEGLTIPHCKKILLRCGRMPTFRRAMLLPSSG